MDSELKNIQDDKKTGSSEDHGVVSVDSAQYVNIKISDDKIGMSVKTKQDTGRDYAFS